MLYPVQQALTKLRFDVGVCRICDNIVQLPRVFLHIIEEVVRIHIRCRSLAAIDTGGIDRVHIICRADAAAAAALRDLGVDLISSIMIFLFHNVKQIFADHLVADIHACQSQQSLGDALGADQLGDFLAALERAAADDQRHMQAAVVARALIVIVSVQMGVAVAGLEMRAMVGSVKDNSILIQTLFFQNCGKDFEYPVEWGMDLQTEHERYLTEEIFKKPVFVTDYPKDIKAFYMRLNDDGKTVAATDCLVPGIGEIIGGSQREERLDVLKARMAELGLKEEDYWWYLELRKYGETKHAGFGLGFERLIMYITGMSNIRDVIPFPRTTGQSDF